MGSTIILTSQSLHTTLPLASASLTHHLSCLSSKSSSQRHDSLTHILPHTHSAPLPILLPPLLPLVLDGSRSVRATLLRVLHALPASISDHVESLLLYIRAGMTHLAAGIRTDAVQVLSWLLKSAGADVVAAPGGWRKTLAAFMALLGWESSSASKSTASGGSFAKAGSAFRPDAASLLVLGEFLHLGLASPPSEPGDAGAQVFPLRGIAWRLRPPLAHAYAHLDLFGGVQDEEGAMLEEKEDRERVFRPYKTGFEKGLDAAAREGGDIGRAAAKVRKGLRVALEGQDVVSN
ncbi:MAG: Testis-expressed sequence 10 protein [Trizodia sp. TS-e1964]|nr:MAG: Testis-expressed sequence 10 protein [Trizodia sp. TS-e1964]